MPLKLNTATSSFFFKDGPDDTVRCSQDVKLRNEKRPLALLGALSSFTEVVRGEDILQE